MSRQIAYEIHPKETFYFGLKVIASVLLYSLMGYGLYHLLTTEVANKSIGTVLLFYASIIVLYLVFSMGIMVGYLKGNAIKVSSTQFSDVSHMAQTQAQLLGLSVVPDVYILQSGGILNAFATRFMGANYVVLYSEVVDAAYAQDVKMLEFILGHELGHIKRGHLIKNLVLFPAFFVPFLSSAYSRACEYTCDSIGHAMSPEGARNGLLLLAGGKNLFAKINQEEYIMQQYNEGGFWHWFAEKVASHPHLTKRVDKFREEIKPKKVFTPVTESNAETPVAEKPDTGSDYSKYMPR